MVIEEDNQRLFEEISKELLIVLSSFYKDKSLGPNGWTVECFVAFFELVGDDLLRIVVEEVRTSGKVLIYFNTTFISIIPKSNKPKSFNEFILITPYNCIYKIIVEVLALKPKGILNEVISLEQFGFLKGIKIHEAYRGCTNRVTL